jgi:hypothetical protein
MDSPEKSQQHSALFELMVRLDCALKGTFTGSREGFVVVNIDEYYNSRDLLLQLFNKLNAEVHRVCFEERLSNRSLLPGKE